MAATLATVIVVGSLVNIGLEVYHRNFTGGVGWFVAALGWLTVMLSH